MNTAQRLKQKARGIQKDKNEATAKRLAEATRRRRAAKKEVTMPLVQRCIEQATKAADEGKIKTDVYAAGEAAFDAADDVASQLRKKGFVVEDKPGYTIFAGMDAEGYGGATSYHAMWYISWDDDNE